MITFLMHKIHEEFYGSSSSTGTGVRVIIEELYVPDVVSYETLVTVKKIP